MNIKHAKTFPRTKSRLGFTLTELMVAVGLSAIGMSIAYPFLVTELNLYVRNFSLNKSNNSLRHSLQVLKRDIDMAIEPPKLVNYTISGGNGVLTPQTDATVSAQGIQIWDNFGPAYRMPSAGGSGGPISDPAAGVTLVRHISSGAGDATSPLPAVGDRLLIMSPAPYSTGMPESVVEGGVTVLKPGRRITSVSLVASDVTGATFKVMLDLTNTALPSAPFPPGDVSVYLIRETAYVTYTVNDASGTAVQRQLLYFASTSNLNKPKIITSDLDPSPKAIDATTGVLEQPFNYYGGRSSLSSLTINLPVRAVDYAQAIASRNVAAGQTNLSSEFNVFIRSNPTMGMKVRID